MGELIQKIHKDSRKTTEQYMRWEYEDVAPMTNPKERKDYLLSQREINDWISTGQRPETGIKVRSADGSTIDLSEVDLGLEINETDSFGSFSPDPTGRGLDMSARALTGARKSALKSQLKKAREKLRTDFSGRSKIKIDKIDGGEQNYVEVQLINADRFQKASDPLKWSVLTLYAGSGQNSQSVGVMVRRTPNEDEVIRTAIDSIEA